jgi:hypothetical protein
VTKSINCLSESSLSDYRFSPCNDALFCLIFVQNRPYNVSFRRILKASDFAEQAWRLCFKKVVFQPRPELSLHFDDTHCAPSVSSLWQRFNLQMRHQLQLLSPVHGTQDQSFAEKNQSINVLLITRSLKRGQFSDISSAASLISAAHLNSNGNNNVLFEHVMSRLFRNEKEIIDSLRTYLDNKHYLFNQLKSVGPSSIVLTVSDVALLSMDEQIKLFHAAHIVIGMHGSGIASAVYMPIGSSPFCCGVLELFPPLQPNGYAPKGYRSMLKKLGVAYERLDLNDNPLELPTTNIANNNSTVELGSIVSIAALTSSLDRLIAEIVKREGSCVLPEVLLTPYF